MGCMGAGVQGCRGVWVRLDSPAGPAEPIADIAGGYGLMDMVC